MNFRNYDPERDREAAHRIWYEIRWITEKSEEAAVDTFLAGGRTLVADIDGEAECLAATMPGAIRYLDEDLSLSAVTAVTTSRIARKQGLAGRLTAQAVAEGAAGGALVSGLGMFEQGFYNRLGFGSGAYEHEIGFDPSQLRVDVRARVPRRLTVDDAEQIHAARLARRRTHGACSILPLNCTEAEMRMTTKGFGLGYGDGPDGELTHFFWCASGEAEQGPYRVNQMAYRTRQEFLELMALLKSLGDQINLVTMFEPSDIQIQDLMEQPFKQRDLTRKGKYECTHTAGAYWQFRMCDVPGCLARTHLVGTPVRFNLKLSDPIENYLDDDAPWRGVTGEYVVTLGEESAAKKGQAAGVPTLSASVGAFTRMWLGVRPASGLAVTDELDGPEELLSELDRVLRLPPPKTDWEF